MAAPMALLSFIDIDFDRNIYSSEYDATNKEMKLNVVADDYKKRL